MAHGDVARLAVDDHHARRREHKVVDEVSDKMYSRLGARAYLKLFLGAHEGEKFLQLCSNMSDRHRHAINYIASLATYPADAEMSFQKIIVAAGHPSLPHGLLDLAQPLDLCVQQNLSGVQLDVGRRGECEKSMKGVEIF